MSMTGQEGTVQILKKDKQWRLIWESIVLELT